MDEKLVKKSKESRIKKNSTHLYLQDKHLEKIPLIMNSKHLQVVYLYNNHIKTIDNLSSLSNLKSLYLQNNNIEQIENLNRLINLKTLFLGHNSICILEGLENLGFLEELHIEKQNLPNKMMLCVDPRSIYGLTDTLRILNISHNNIDSLDSFIPLKRLEIIIASHNNLDDIKNVCFAIKRWYNLKEANFIGNNITKLHRYRENIIASSYELELLDNKIVTKISRDFIKRFEEEKLNNVRKKSVNLTEIIDDLPKHHPVALQKAASASVLKSSKYKILNNDLSTFDERNAVYIAWNALPEAKPPSKLKGFSKRMGSEKKNVLISDFSKFSNF